MITAAPCSRLLLALAFLLLASPARAVIVVNGLTTQQYPGYATSVTFTVPNEAGFTIVSQVDGVTIPAAAPFTETRVGYHELFVTKTPTAGGAAETRLVQFIIRARINADTGLADWVPLEAVDAPADALATTEAAFLAPARVVAGMAFPLGVRLTVGGGIAKLNATALATSADGRAATWRIYRGAGAGVWTAPTTAGPLELTLRLGDRTFTRSVEVVAAPVVQTLSGAVSGTQSFGPNAFVNITSDVSVPAGATLRFEAGTVVRVSAGATIDVQGALVVAGTAAAPALFTRLDPALPWGGFWIRGTSASGNITGAFLTGAGAQQNWMSGKGYSAHKPEQPVVACDGCPVNLTDTWIVDNPHGQAAHGNSAQVTFTRCVVQRTKSCGQYNSGRARLLDSHIVEIPVADYVFTDDDNDGFYITGPSTAGPHELTNSVIGWCKDDGVDAGSGSAGTVNTSGCWFDSMFHEAMAWSESRTANVTNTVSINSGQGIEAGFGSPAVTATNLLLVGNLIGARYGDNYDWSYDGTLNVQNSLLLHNDRDVFGIEWDSWNYRTERMTIQGNAFTAPLALHPSNSVFNSGAHAAQLAAFLTAPDQRRGFGVARRPRQNARASYGGDVTVHLDRPATAPLSLPWRVVAKASLAEDAEIIVASGALALSAGMNAATFTLPALTGEAAAATAVAVLFDDTADAVATGAGVLLFADLPQPPPNPTTTLIPFGAVWKYLDNGSNQGTAWRAAGFNDASWASGPAELGYGNNDEVTPIGFIDADPVAAGVQKNATTYFRAAFTVADPAAFTNLDLSLRYDDGGVVYLNGQRVAATVNMPIDPAFNYYLGGTAPPNNSMLAAIVPAAALLPGTNTIAVEIHQQLATSSDISFNLRLIGNPAPPPAQILSRAAALDGALHFVWTTPGVIPQHSLDLVNWQDRPDLASPLRVAPEGAQGFFRLRLP